MAPTIHYFPIRGRAEVLKLIYAFKGIEFDCVNCDSAEMKSNLDTYPFGQCPRLVDDEVDCVQSNTMIRHLGRKYDLYGNTEKEKTTVDMVLDGVESIRGKYLPLIYGAQLADDAKEQYFKDHISKDSATGRNGGAHFAYLEHILQRNGGGSAYFVGDGLTVADLAEWEIYDLHNRIFGEKLRNEYPALAAHFDRIAAIPGIKAYLEGPKRMEQINGNKLG